MKKIILIFSLFYGLGVNVEAPKMPINNSLFWSIQIEFLTSWEYFRMLQNPMIPNEEKYNENGSWKRPSQIPDTFYTKQFDIAMKVYRWEDVYKRSKDPYYEQVRSPFWFVIEKENGLTRIDKEFVVNPEYKMGDTAGIPIYIYIYI